MMLKHFVLAAAAVPLVASPVAAQTADRVAAPVAETEGQGLRGSAFPGWIWALIVALGVTWIIIEDDNNDDVPVSP